LALQREQENNKFYIAAMLGLLALAGFAVFSFLRTRKHARTLADKNRIILEEQQRANGLLLNILPKSIADELISQGHTQARYFADAGVMFADFVGFTHIAGASRPQELVEDLHTAFSAFDQIITKHGLEKIKTIGDAYMCASGLPAAEQGNRLKAMILAATEIQQWLHDWNLRRSGQKQAQYIARIGIHRGPVVAGVVGSKKFAFDIWGDTVNTAARIEQAGEGGKINISEAVYEVVGKEFSCVPRGKIAIKNKTPQEMYFVTMNDE
jgi:adenylate cyclase